MRADRPWRDIVTLMTNQHGVFHRRQAVELGLTASRIRRAKYNGELQEVATNVFALRSGAASPFTVVKAHTLVGGLASHRTAAWLHGFDGFRGAPPSPVEILRTRFEHAQFDAVREHRWRRLPEGIAVQVQGIPTTNIAATLAQLGASASYKRVEQALDGVLRDGHSLAWISETLDRLERPGPTGLKTLRAILADPSRAGALPDSWFERLVARIVEDQGLPRPELQHRVKLGAIERRLDLAYPEIKLGIECHSKEFHLKVTAFNDDSQRHLDLAEAGWEIIYVTWQMAQHPVDLIRRIRAVYHRRAAAQQALRGLGQHKSA